MTHTYNISGMTCSGCVSKARSELLKLENIIAVEVQLVSPQATITMQKHITLQELQLALKKAGNYIIQEADAGMNEATAESSGWLKTYKPILVIGAFIMGATLLIELNRGAFILESWMNNFMAGFFLVFSFFKFLDLKGFAESYATYDLIGRKWAGWGYVYAIIEMGLGLAYLLRFYPLLTNAITFLVMSISIVGVLKSVLNKRKIRCACLGAVFNLPMSTITIIEDGLMIAMAGIMILTML